VSLAAMRAALAALSRPRAPICLLVLALALASMLSGHGVAQAASDDAIDVPLTPLPGDAASGRAIVANRQVGLCLLCHSGPFPEERLQGTLAPDLAGAGARWSDGQLRLRLVDSRRIDPESMMPAYFRADGHVRVGAQWQGKTVLSAQQVEDVIAFLRTLK
jgi:L-cysteine S-thiosulfotransferase